MNRPQTVIATALLFLSLGAGCATAPKQTSLMKASKNFDISAAELRLRVRELASQLGGIVEEAADDIRRASDELEIRRNATRWKMEVIPTANQAIFRQDPLLALADIWAFALQHRDFLRDGEGRDAFGEFGPIAVEAADEMIVAIEAIAVRASVTGNIDAARTRLEEWAAENPIRGPSFARTSMINYLADAAAASRAGGFAAVGTLTTDVADIAARLDLFADQIPKLARWQSEYVVQQYLSQEDVHELIGDIHRLSTSIESAGGTVDELGDVALRLTDSLASEDGGAASLVERERDAVLRAMDTQVAAALRHLTRERVAVMAQLEAERDIVLAAVDRERVATLEILQSERRVILQETELMADRLLERAGAEVQGTVDRLFWRLTILLAVVLVAGAVALVWTVSQLRPAAV